MNIITKLINLKKTVFRYEELLLLFPEHKKKALDQFLFRAKKSWNLLNPIKWIRTLTIYNPQELSNKIKLWSYISCETVLFQNWAFFQFYWNTYSAVSSNSSKYEINWNKFVYYKIKNSISQNKIWIREYENYNIATTERALCDYIYLNPKWKIDAPEVINHIRLKQILPLYPKKTILYINKLFDVQN